MRTFKIHASNCKTLKGYGIQEGLTCPIWQNESLIFLKVNTSSIFSFKRTGGFGLYCL
jgi:hypothetical protein